MNRIKKLMVIGVFGIVLMGVAATPVSAKTKKKPIDISKYVVKKGGFFELKKNKKIKIKKNPSNDLFSKKNKKRYFINDSVLKYINKYKLKTKITGFNGTRTVKGFDPEYESNYGKTKYYYTFTYKGKKYCFKKTSNCKNKIKTFLPGLSFYDQNEKSIENWMNGYSNLKENAYNFVTSKFSVKISEFDMQYSGKYIVNCEANFNLNNPNLIDYDAFKISDKNSEYHNYFEKNNIHSNSDLYNFVKNKISGLNNIVVNATYKANGYSIPYLVFNGDISKTHPTLYAEINKRFGGDMFWRLINPTYSFSCKLEGKNKTVTLGSASYMLNRTSIFSSDNDITLTGLHKEGIKVGNMNLSLERYTNNRHDFGEKGLSWDLICGNLSADYIYDLK